MWEDPNNFWSDLADWYSWKGEIEMLQAMPPAEQAWYVQQGMKDRALFTSTDLPILIQEQFFNAWNFGQTPDFALPGQGGIPSGVLQDDSPWQRLLGDPGGTRQLPGGLPGMGGSAGGGLLDRFRAAIDKVATRGPVLPAVKDFLGAPSDVTPLPSPGQQPGQLGGIIQGIRDRFSGNPGQQRIGNWGSEPMVLEQGRPGGGGGMRQLMDKLNTARGTIGRPSAGPMGQIGDVIGRAAPQPRNWFVPGGRQESTWYTPGRIF